MCYLTCQGTPEEKQINDTDFALFSKHPILLINPSKGGGSKIEHRTMFSATLARPLHCRTHFHDHLTLQYQQSNTGSPLLFTTTAKTKPKNLANFLALSCFICRFYVCVTETFVKNVFVIT